VIDPPQSGDPYPGLLPAVGDQWLLLDRRVRIAVVAVPSAVVVVVLLVNLTAGVTAAVLAVGVAAASAVFVRNRTDRHNAAVERGDIECAADPHFESLDPAGLDSDVAARLARLGYPPDDVGDLMRFDGGWLVRHRNPRDVAAVVGDDGGHALFDPRRITDLWAVTEYSAGRGHEPEG
jgi:hypothetical protein